MPQHPPSGQENPRFALPRARMRRQNSPQLPGFGSLHQAVANHVESLVDAFVKSLMEKIMQKKIIALALAGMSSVAFAQSNVTISGQAKLSMTQVSASGATAGANAISRTRINDETSSLKFAGTESLGNGMRAGFQFELDMFADTHATVAAPTTGNFIGSRNSGVYVEGGWGRALLGRWDVHYTSHASVDSAGLNDMPLATNSLSILMSNNSVAGTGAGGRVSNVAAYITPNFNGLSALIGYSAMTEVTGAAAAGAKSKGWVVTPTYSNGPIAVTYSHLATDTDAAAGFSSAKGRFDRLGFAYTFPMGLKAGLIWDKNSTTTAAGANSKRTAWAIPISYTMGAHTFYFTHARAGENSGALVVGLTNTDTSAKMNMLAWSYALSKRTQVNLSWTKLSNDANATYDFWTRPVGGGQGAGADPTMFGLGLRHSF